MNKTKSNRELAEEATIDIMKAMSETDVSISIIIRDRILELLNNVQKPVGTHRLRTVLIDPDSEHIQSLADSHGVSMRLIESYENGRGGGGLVIFTGSRRALIAFTLDAFHCKEMLNFIKPLTEVKK